MRGRDIFKKYSKVINLLVKICALFPKKIRIKLFEFVRMIKGTKGLAIRYILFKSIVKKCGNNVSIHPNVFILNPGNLSVGDNVSIHPMCYIEALGGIELGNNISIAHGATLMSTGHNINRLDVPINDQGVFKKKLIINDNVWIGAKSTLLAGIVIESGSVVGAGALVNKNIKRNMVVGGVPAKELKERV